MAGSACCRILGIDPGSRATGFGIVDFERDRARFVAAGTVRTPDGELALRLRRIFEELSEVVRERRPEEVAIERVFMHRNADSALKLGQARAAALCATFEAELAVYEYAPRAIKQAVTGTGAAGKGQVERMVRALLNLREPLGSDAADALAVAVCHGHTRRAASALRRAAQ